MVDSLLQDLRYAARTLVGAPGFAAAAILTLALGIGATTAIFSVVNTVLLRPLPYLHPDRVVRPFENVPAAESSNRRAIRLGGMNALEWVELGERTTTLARVCTLTQSLVTLVGAGDAAFVNGASLSPGTTAMFGVQPMLGRWFTAEEERAGSNVIVLSHAAWRRYFAGDLNVLGRSVAFTGNSTFIGAIGLGTAYTVVGVMPRGFYFPDDRTDFWTPAAPARPRDSRQRLAAIAELREGVSVAAATTELATIVAALRGVKTPFAPTRFELQRMSDDVDTPIHSALLVLMGAVGFVLLIACANVANLLLARTAAREREIAIRVAIGASRGRLVRQLLTESVLLALVGGAGGAALAYGGVAMFRTLGTTLSRFDLGDTVVFPRLADIAIDVDVLLFTAAISIATGLLFGLAPAFRAIRVQHLAVRRSARLAHSLLAAEIALALPLIVGGGLLVRSFVTLVTIDRGYDAANVLTFQVAARGDRYPPEQLKLFAEELAGRLTRVADVVAVGYARQLPMVRLQDTHSFRRTPEPPPPGPAPDGADGRYVSAGYIQAIGGRLVAGHWPARPGDVLINRTLARREFGAASAVGETVFIGRSSIPHEVAGVVDDERLYGLDRDPPPQFFADLSLWDGPARILFPVGPYFAVRTRGNPESIVAALTGIVRQMDPDAPLYNVASLDRILSNAVTLPRLYAVLVAVFATLAVTLAAIGVYGVMAYGVTQRTREIGIRMALGARGHQVLRLVLRRTVAHAAIGLIVGIVSATMLTRYLQTLLFGITPLDPPTFAAASLLFVCVAVVAAVIPARHATTVDPLVALRCE